VRKSEVSLFNGLYPSPLGLLTITSDGDSITSILFPKNESTLLTENSNSIIADCITQLNEYFQGTRKIFNLPLNPFGTDFQKKVWDKIYEIPFGETKSYGEIANSLGDSKLSRAVGLANGANPIPVIIPCHRVIGSNGTLTGYAGGLERKIWLLNHEQSFYTATVGQLKLF
jgi:methylated-DNA-[protein]-cysteine S-methyltransferase